MDTIYIGLNNQQHQTSERRKRLQAQLEEIEQEIERHKRAAQVYGFINAEYRPHAWYWESVDMIFKVRTASIHVSDIDGCRCL